MTQFKVGDRVRYTGKQDMLTPNLLGKIATVTAVASDGYVEGMKWDDPNEDHKSCFAGNLELIEQGKDQMTKTDWSGELEAYHEDGRVVPVTFVEDDGGIFLPMRVDGAPEDFDCPYDDRFFNKDGTREKSKWRIRNRQPTTNDRLARLEAFVARVAGSGPGDRDNYLYEAKALVAEIAPVDLDLIEARKIAMDEYQPSAWNDEQWESRVMAGDEDEDRSVRSALAGIRRGRALERGES